MIPAGTEVPYRVTYLEMNKRPAFASPALPEDLQLERAIDPPVWYFLSLYQAVGQDWSWEAWLDQAEKDPEGLQAFVRDPEVVIWTAVRHGWPHGFFMLDWRESAVCELAYFGLVPQAIGQGIGRPLLETAIATGWAREGVRRMTVNTCTLDHPSALTLYQKVGFSPYRVEDHTRVLTFDRFHPVPPLG